MTKEQLRFAELLVLAGVTFALIGLAGWMAYLDKMGESFGSLFGAIVIGIQAIRNIGTGQAMQSLVDHLGKSAPVSDDTP